MTSMASTSSLTRMAPSWATIPPPIFAATMKPKMNGTTSRVVQNALKIGPAMPAPIAREIAEPVTPQVAPVRKVIQTITSTLAVAISAVWRSTSAEYWPTWRIPSVPRQMKPKYSPVASMIGRRVGRSTADRARAPSRGREGLVCGAGVLTAAASTAAGLGFVLSDSASCAVVDLRVERLEEQRVDDADHEHGDQAGDHRLVHRPAHALGPAADRKPLERGDDADDGPEQRHLDHARPQVDEVGQQQQVLEESRRGAAVEEDRRREHSR